MIRGTRGASDVRGAVARRCPTARCPQCRERHPAGRGGGGTRRAVVRLLLALAYAPGLRMFVFGGGGSVIPAAAWVCLPPHRVRAVVARHT